MHNTPSSQITTIPPPETNPALSTRATAAKMWYTAAAYEHASVASFAEHLLELMASPMPCPPEILESVAVAAADEVLLLVVLKL